MGHTYFRGAMYREKVRCWSLRTCKIWTKSWIFHRTNILRFFSHKMHTSHKMHMHVRHLDFSPVASRQVSQRSKLDFLQTLISVLNAHFNFFKKYLLLVANKIIFKVVLFYFIAILESRFISSCGALLSV